MSGRREASSVLVLVECEPSWAWLPPASPQGATTKHSALPRLTLCRVRKGDNPLHCVVPPEQHPPRDGPEGWGYPRSYPRLPKRVRDSHLEEWDGPSGGSHTHPQPTHPYFARQEAPGLGHNWSRCLLLWVAVGGIHWTNQGSHVCRPIEVMRDEASHLSLGTSGCRGFQE